MADPRLKRLQQLKALALNNPSEEEARSAAVAALKLEKELEGEKPLPNNSRDRPISYDDVMQAKQRAERQQEARARQAESQYTPPPRYQYTRDKPSDPPSQKEQAERLVAERERRIAAEVSARLAAAVTRMQQEFDVRLEVAWKAEQRKHSQVQGLKDECKALQSRIQELELLVFELRPDQFPPQESTEKDELPND